jgi:hypothetical protein
MGSIMNIDLPEQEITVSTWNRLLIYVKNMVLSLSLLQSCSQNLFVKNSRVNLNL